jgi:hypothetical protein
LQVDDWALATEPRSGALIFKNVKTNELRQVSRSVQRPPGFEGFLGLKRAGFMEKEGEVAARAAILEALEREKEGKGMGWMKKLRKLTSAREVGEGEGGGRGGDSNETPTLDAPYERGSRHRAISSADDALRVRCPCAGDGAIDDDDGSGGSASGAQRSSRHRAVSSADEALGPPDLSKLGTGPIEDEGEAGAVIPETRDRALSAGAAAAAIVSSVANAMIGAKGKKTTIARAKNAKHWRKSVWTVETPMLRCVLEKQATQGLVHPWQKRLFELVGFYIRYYAEDALNPQTIEREAADKALKVVVSLTPPPRPAPPRPAPLRCPLR